MIARGRRGFPVLGAGCLLLLVGPASARLTPQSQPESHAKVSLIREDPSTSPGKTLWVGLLFQLDPGWHIYWQNAGDSGEPPKVQWELPAGYKAGAIRWPLPIRLGSGSVIDYGYEQQALLMAPITAATPAKPNAPVSVSATVGYVVCREICIPGKAHLTLAGPASPDERTQYRKLFADARALLPRPAPSIWKVSARPDQKRVILTIEGAKPPKEAAFFPLDPGVIGSAAPQTMEASKHGFRLVLRKSDNAIQSVAALRGVLVLDHEQGFEIDAPLALQSP